MPAIGGGRDFTAAIAAVDASAVHTSGDEAISGTKLFAGPASIGPGDPQPGCILTVQGNMFFAKDFAISFGVNASGAGNAPFIRSLGVGLLDFKLGLLGARFITNNEGAVPVQIDGAGRVSAPLLASSASADPALANGQFAFWLDEATSTLKVRVRKSDGSLLSGSMALA